jgi:hypothetical protein
MLKSTAVVRVLVHQALEEKGRRRLAVTPSVSPSPSFGREEVATYLPRPMICSKLKVGVVHGRCISTFMYYQSASYL